MSKTKIKLPPLSDDFHLRTYGYSIKKSELSRHNALRRAIHATDILFVLRRLNLARNKQSTVAAKKIMTSDIEWLKKLEKKIGPVPGGRKKFRDRMKGGFDVELVEDTGSDEYEMVEAEVEDNGSLSIYESHTINDSEILFYSLTSDDISDILKLTSEICPDVTEDIVQSYLSDNKWICVGLKKDTELKSMIAMMINDDAVDVMLFCSMNGFTNIMISFVNNFSQKHGYSVIRTIVNTKSKDAHKYINAWFSNGLTVTNIDETGLLLLLSNSN